MKLQDAGMWRVGVHVLLFVAVAQLSGPVATNADETERLRVTKTGHTYERVENVWYLSTAGGKTPANLSSIIVQIADKAILDGLQRKGVAAPSRVSDRMPGDFYAIEIPKGLDPFDYMKRVESLPGVTWARFEIFGQLHGTANDPFFPNQWTLHEPVTRVTDAWDLVSVDPTVSVGVVDLGVELHEDLPAFTTVRSANGQDDGHGTAVAGIIAATRNNAKGVAGVASGVDLYSAEIGFDWGEADIVASIVALQDAGVRVVNMSLGYNNTDAGDFLPTVAAIDEAVDQHDMIFVVASGNEDNGTTRTDFPANYSKTIAVSAVDYNGDVHGQVGTIDVVAPGWISVTTTDVPGCVVCVQGPPQDCEAWAGGIDEGDYMCVEDDPNCDDCLGPCPQCFGGTSAAAPFASGVVALMLSANPTLAWDEVTDILRWSAVNVAEMGANEVTSSWGHGQLDAVAAVRSAQAAPPNGIITTNTTWSGRVVLTRDIKVAEGATLTVQPGTTVFVAGTDAQNLFVWEDRVEIVVEGTLDVNGTAGSPVLFTSIDEASESDWVNIAVSNGSVEMDHTTLRHAEYGLNASTREAITLNNCTFESNKSDIDVSTVDEFPDSVGIHNCTFNIGGGTAIDIKTHDVTVANCTFTGNGATQNAVKLHNNGYTTVNAEIVDNTFNGQDVGTAIALHFGASVVEGNSITNFDRGIWAIRGQHYVGSTAAPNDIADNRQGIFAACPPGGQCPASCPRTLSLVVRGNHIHDNADGVVARRTGGTMAVDLGTTSDWGYNTIVNNTNSCISNLSSSCGPVYAAGNYWGTCNPLPPLCWVGEVDLSDYQCQPFTIAPPSRDEPEPAQVPRVTEIVGIAPNPFNPTTTVTFNLATGADAAIQVFDVAGRRVRSEPLGARTPGVHQWIWNGRDQQGNEVSSGVYFIVLRAGELVDRRKALLLK